MPIVHPNHTPSPSLDEIAAAASAGLLEKVLAERRLRHFIRLMWPIVEPKEPLVSGWLIDGMAEHLEAVTSGQIKRLIMNVRPGTMKSLISSVFWPSWEWGPMNLPHMRYICASYAQFMAIRDNGRFRSVIGSDVYSKHWADRFTISEKDDSKIKIGNNKTGWKEANSVGGLTGARGDRVILDDPNSIQEADSEKIRQSTNIWLTETLPTRLNNPKNSAIVVIQQRLHQEDATGTLLGGGGDWVHFCVPNEYETGRHCVTVIGWSDPRSEDGELCFPERFPREVVEMEKISMGPHAVAGQFQQMPAPRGGELIMRDWWQTWGDPDNGAGALFPPFSLVIGVLDGAYTTKESNDPSGMMVMGMFDDPRTGHPQVMVANCWVDRLALHDLVKRVDNTCRKYRVSVLLIENKASGHSVNQELRRLLATGSYGIEMVDPGKMDKVARAIAITPLMAEGLVWRPVTDWSDKVVDECALFPRGAHDERVDCLVHGLRWLRDQGVLERPIETRMRESALARPADRRQRMALYRT